MGCSSLSCRITPIGERTCRSPLSGMAVGFCHSSICFCSCNLVDCGRGGENFWMALEEPELHVPPSLQRRLVHRIQSLSRQTLVSTHSPMVAALADSSGVAVLRNEGGVLTSVPLLQSTLPADTPTVSASCSKSIASRRSRRSCTTFVLILRVGRIMNGSVCSSRR